MSFAECPVSIGLLKAGLIDEKMAMQIARLDADPDSVRDEFKALDQSTAGQSQEQRSEAVAAKLKRLIRDHGLAPKGNPGRWEIRQQMKMIRDEDAAARLDLSTEQQPEFAGDPRCRHGTQFVEDDD